MIRRKRLGALHEANDTIHLTRYQPGGMVVAFNAEFITFDNILVNRVANKLSNTLSINRIK